MIKTIALALALLTLPAVTVYACEAGKPNRVEIQQQIENGGLKSQSFTGDQMKNFMQNLETKAGFDPAPVDYDEVVLVYNDVSGKLILMKDGCVAIASNQFQLEKVRPYLTEAQQ